MPCACRTRRPTGISLPHPDAVGLVGGGAQLLVAECLVVGDVAREEAHLAVALEGEDVRGDAVQEPAVVADDDDAPGKGLEAGLQRAERVDIEVVGRLVEEQHVAARLEQLGQVDAVPLPSRQRADELLLVRAAEVEARHVRARGQLARADLDDLGALGDLLEDGLVGRKRIAALVDVAQLDRIADLDRAGVGHTQVSLSLRCSGANLKV